MGERAPGPGFSPVWALLFLYSLGYVLAVIKRAARWPSMMASVNSVMGVFVIVVLLLSNSPLLDFRKLALASQMNRLASGAVLPEDFDDQYLRNELARPGYMALQDLKEKNPALWAGLEGANKKPDQAMRAQNGDIEGIDVGSPRSVPAHNGALVLAPTDLALPPSVEGVVETLMIEPEKTAAYVLAVDFDQDGQMEYAVLFFGEAGDRQKHSYYFKKEGAVWKKRALRLSRSRGALDFDEVQKTQALLAPAQLNNLVLGPWLFKPD